MVVKTRKVKKHTRTRKVRRNNNNNYRRLKTIKNKIGGGVAVAIANDEEVLNLKAVGRFYELHIFNDKVLLIKKK
jgi:hypothetical protein